MIDPLRKSLSAMRRRKRQVLEHRSPQSLGWVFKRMGVSPHGHMLLKPADLVLTGFLVMEVLPKAVSNRMHPAKDRTWRELLDDPAWAAAFDEADKASRVAHAVIKADADPTYGL